MSNKLYRMSDYLKRKGMAASDIVALVSRRTDETEKNHRREIDEALNESFRIQGDRDKDRISQLEQELGLGNKD